ncbi:MAG: hypothetical protein JSS45_09890 [Proteobacteria bacterium]|nr:hypothetical protein [Pseudomonadota bacterium]
MAIVEHADSHQQRTGGEEAQIDLVPRRARQRQPHRIASSVASPPVVGAEIS